MDFGLRETDQLITDSITSFAAENLRPNLRAAEAARAVSPTVRAGFAQLGLDGLELPQAIGGEGLGMLTRVLTNIGLAKADAGAALALDRIGPALHVLQAFGGDEAVRLFVKPILDEPGARIALIVEDFDRTTRAGDRIGAKAAWIPTERADLVVGLGPASAWVSAGPATLEPAPGAALHAAGASRLALEGPVAAAWTDGIAAAGALARVRLYVASLLVGVLLDATEFSREYAQGRVAFGQPIAHHQGLAFLIVDMFTAVELCRLMVEDAARRMESGQEATQQAAAAFVECIEASRFVGPNGVQILGGHGFMRDYPVEKAMRDCRALGLLAGGLYRARDDAVCLVDPTTYAFEGT